MSLFESTSIHTPVKTSEVLDAGSTAFIEIVF